MNVQNRNEEQARCSAINSGDNRRGRFGFESELWLAKSLDIVFPFFANARNLQTLTPPWINFRVLTPEPIVIQKGTLIDYRLRLHGIPFRWRSEISVWDPPFQFVDRQLKGPYRVWIHRHQFYEKDGGTVVSDQIEYDILGGHLLNRLLVRPDIERIFLYRREKMKELFGT